MFAITFKPQVFQPIKCNNKLKKTKYVVKCKNKEQISKKQQVNNRKFLAEKINGRLAMIGFCVGNGYKYFSGMNYIDQFQSNFIVVIGLSSLIGYLSFDEIKKRKSFWNEFETFNGRVAMLELVFETFMEALLYIDENVLFTIE